MYTVGRKQGIANCLFVDTDNWVFGLLSNIGQDDVFIYASLTGTLTADVQAWNFWNGYSWKRDENNISVTCNVDKGTPHHLCVKNFELVETTQGPIISEPFAKDRETFITIQRVRYVLPNLSCQLLEFQTPKPLDYFDCSFLN